MVVSNDPENPAEFEWTSQFGLEANTNKVLEEFWAAHSKKKIITFLNYELFNKNL